MCISSMHKLETVWKLSSFPNSFQMGNFRFINLEIVCSRTCTNQFPMCALELFLPCMSSIPWSILGHYTNCYTRAFILDIPGLHKVQLCNNNIIVL